MKKNGFTLAEVLITLAIIGVVATLTLPSLMTNTAEQQAVTGYRKALNTLNEVGQMSAAVDGFDYSGISATMAPSASASVIDDNGQVKQTLWAMMSNRAQVDKTMSGTNVIKDGGCASLSQIFFRDGTVLCYTDVATNGSADTVISGYIDTHGVKGPNKKSECKNKNCKPADRAIGDQFPVTLRGGVAMPGIVTVSGGVISEGNDTQTYAALWAMRK